MQLPAELCCPEHRTPLAADDGTPEITLATRFLSCRLGCQIPVIAGIPRFVSSDSYAAGFGKQWKAFRRTQLDSFTGVAISRDRLTRCLGGSLDAVRNKAVLEVGCGAGRFTELLLSSGARVFASDLSSAVEANYDNCHGAPGYFICQADLHALPVYLGSFDVVVCLGVIQHTPEPEKTIAALCSFVKPDGLLVIDHYRYGPEDMTPIRQRIRRVLVGRSPRFSLGYIRFLVALLWPVHRLLWHFRSHSSVAAVRRTWLSISPVLDYHDYYSQLGPRLLYAWAALDTHDALTDRYKHKRTVEEIRECLQDLGMEGIEARYGGNGVEARARKPLGNVGSNERTNQSDLIETC
jgi:SAM-dependent methyltransferase